MKSPDLHTVFHELSKHYLPPSTFLSHYHQLLTEPSHHFATHDRFVAAFDIAIFVGVICWLLSLPTKKYSWVDKLWGIMPGVYCWFFASQLTHSVVELATHYPKLLVMCLLPTMWGLRLTYNFYRRGGFAWDAEDYRWVYVAKLPVIGSPLVWPLFNFGFIGLYQNLLFVTIAWPVYSVVQATRYSLTRSAGQLSAADYAITVLWLATWMLEIAADQQQWNFYSQREKFRALSKAEQQRGLQIGQYNEDHQNGYLAHGLFAWSRHPNFAAEQSLWFIYALYASVATGSLWDWSMVGAIIYTTSIFQGSTALTEHITRGKYPSYAQYQQRVPRFLPFGYGTAPPAKKLQ